MMLLFALACGPRLADPPPAGPVALQARLEARAVGSGEPGELWVEVTTDADWSFAAPTPQVDGLTIEQLEPEESGVGDRLVTRFHYALRGEDGSYVVPPLSVAFSGPAGQSQTLESGPLYLDIGVKGPSSEVGDLLAAPPAPTPAWPYALAVAAAVGVAGAGFGLWVARRPRPAPPPPPPPDPAEVALAAWAAAWADPSLDEHGLAQRMSAIFRRYLEQALGVEAESQTSFEVMDRLREHPRFTPSLQDRAGRLLTATDLVKFARQGDRSLFDALDRDLREVVEATRERQEEAPGVE